MLKAQREMKVREKERAESLPLHHGPGKDRQGKAREANLHLQ